MTWTFEALVDDLVSEDNGDHLVAYGLADEVCPLYVHLLSEGTHDELRSLLGKRVRITIKVTDDDEPTALFVGIPDHELDFLMRWATRHGAALVLEGEVGFGRECVGILKYDHYPSWRDFDRDRDWAESEWVVPEAAPPEGVENEYHKSDVLAVLGRGPAAVHELYLWVKHLDEHGIGISSVPRKFTSIEDRIFHGDELFMLTRVDG